MFFGQSFADLCRHCEFLESSHMGSRCRPFAIERAGEGPVLSLPGERCVNVLRRSSEIFGFKLSSSVSPTDQVDNLKVTR